MSSSIKTAPEPMPPYQVKRFTVEEYQWMINGGLFADDEKVELLEGWIIPKMARNTLHELVMVRVTAALSRLIPEGWRLRAQLSITTGDSQPEPDFAIARGEGDDYVASHPGPTDLAIVIEVSDSSLARDRGFKTRLYGRAGISTYWIVNVSERRIEVFTDPTGPIDSPGYRSRFLVNLDEEVPLEIEGTEIVRIAARTLLPRD